jgi:hypothetical protein
VEHVLVELEQVVGLQASGRAVAVLANDTRSVDRMGQLILEPPKARPV